MDKVVEILWEDAIWDMDGDFSKYQLSKTVGYMIDKTDEHIVVCQEYDAFGERKSIQRIPMSIVRSVLIFAE